MTRRPGVRPVASSGRNARSSALSDDGRPAYDANHAGKLAALGCPAFAGTPTFSRTSWPPRCAVTTSPTGPRRTISRSYARAHEGRAGIDARWRPVATAGS